MKNHTMRTTIQDTASFLDDMFYLTSFDGSHFIQEILDACFNNDMSFEDTNKYLDEQMRIRATYLN